ncbi:MAG: methyltransferase domain-containing protein [Candidatus Aenigmatarchaeota archaeon]
MKPEKDAYGQEIWAYFKGKESFEIVERDDGYFDVSSGAKSYFSEYKNWPAHEKKVMKFVKGKVLDVGCGAGRHTIYLQKKGFDVVGIDNSPLAIKICRLRGLKKAKIMSITEVGKFKPNFFDTRIMMGNNFGLFGSFKRAKFLLKIKGNGMKVLILLVR